MRGGRRELAKLALNASTDNLQRGPHMLVKLLSHTTDPERTVAMAGRLCYSGCDIASLESKTDDDNAAKLIEKLVQMGHLSVLEHASFTFGIEGISRACSHQLVRHRIASFSQQSQRYVELRDLDFTVPPGIAADQVAAEEFSAFIETAQTCYNKLLDRGIPAEDARYVLPNAGETKLIFTANARSLLNFFELRLCTRAQWEIRQVAAVMLAEVRTVAPDIFKLAGPTCESSGYCREGEKGCGRV